MLQTLHVPIDSNEQAKRPIQQNDTIVVQFSHPYLETRMSFEIAQDLTLKNLLDMYFKALCQLIEDCPKIIIEGRTYYYNILNATDVLTETDIKVYEPTQTAKEMARKNIKITMYPYNSIFDETKTLQELHITNGSILHHIYNFRKQYYIEQDHYNSIAYRKVDPISFKADAQIIRSIIDKISQQKNNNVLSLYRLCVNKIISNPSLLTLESQKKLNENILEDLPVLAPTSFEELWTRDQTYHYQSLLERIDGLTDKDLFRHQMNINLARASHLITAEMEKRLLEELGQKELQKKSTLKKPMP